MLLNIKKYLKRKSASSENIKKIELTNLKKTYSKDRFKEVNKRRKNFILLFFLTLSSWVTLVYIILETDPMKRWSMELFFIVFFFCVYFTSFIVFFNKKIARGVAASFTLFVFLRFIGQANIISVLIIIFMLILYLWISQRRN